MPLARESPHGGVHALLVALLVYRVGERILFAENAYHGGFERLLLTFGVQFSREAEYWYAKCMKMREVPDGAWESVSQDTVEGFRFDAAYEFRVAVAVRSIADPQVNRPTHTYHFRWHVARTASGGRAPSVGIASGASAPYHGAWATKRMP